MTVEITPFSSLNEDFDADWRLSRWNWLDTAAEWRPPRWNWLVSAGRGWNGRRRRDVHTTRLMLAEFIQLRRGNHLATDRGKDLDFKTSGRKFYRIFSLYS